MGQVQGSLDPVDQHKTHGRWSVVLLVLSFVASFLFACALLLAIGHYSLHAPRSLWPFGSIGTIPATRSAADAHFVPFTVNHSGTYIKVPLAGATNPTQGEDFSLLLWFKLRKAPGIGEAVGVVGKFDSELPGRPGYAISLEGAPDGIRPRVYLSSGDHPGRWYSFSSYPINRRDWYLLSVSLVGDTFVTSSLGRAFVNEAPVLLGGHRLSGTQLPQSKADLVVGAYGASRFRGQVGPFGVLSGKGLSQELPTILGALAADPGSLPRVSSTERIRLWGSPLEDRGPQGAQLVPFAGQSAQSSIKGRAAQGRQAQPPTRIKPPKKASKQTVKRKK